MNYQSLHKKSIREGFAEFHKENPQIFKEFERVCLIQISSGRNKLSAKEIINYIRWNRQVQTTDRNWKINDAFQSYFARLFTSIHPEHSDKFTFRKLRNEEPGPYMRVEKNGQIAFL